MLYSRARTKRMKASIKNTTSFSFNRPLFWPVILLKTESTLRIFQKSLALKLLRMLSKILFKISLVSPLLHMSKTNRTSLEKNQSSHPTYLATRFSISSRLWTNLSCSKLRIKVLFNRFSIRKQTIYNPL